MAEELREEEKKELWDNLRKIKAFSQQPNALLDKQKITEKDSLMYPVYEHALRALQNVMDSSIKWVKESEKSPNKDFYGYGNNVIAFCAPRGQGKTSAMLSLSHALMHCDQLDQHRDIEIAEQWKKTLAGKIFHIMPPIDPTVLDGKESVVNLVLAWLFQEIKDAWKDCKDSPEQIEKDKLELLQHFQKCKECLARHNGTKDVDFSDLIKKSIIFEIKEHLYAIINCYFRIRSCSEKDNYLVIQLDDTDMDMVNAYDVLEDVRKFLSLPRTIVLMATYLRQLRMLVAKHYEDVLSFPHNNKGENQHLIDYMQMAAKYIDKLIPAQQMIHIGSFRNQLDLNNRVSIHSFLEANSDKDKSTGTEPKKNESDDLEKAFFALIYAKTGLRFEKHSTYVNNILPTTLRGLVHLFQLLERMDKPKLNEKDGFQSYYDYLKLKQRNLVSFEDYFRNDWCYSNLVETDQEIMWKISQAHVDPKLRIILNLLAKRWEWSDVWMRNRIRSNLPSKLKKSSISFTTGAKWNETPEAEALIKRIVESSLPVDRKLYKNISLQYEFKTQKDISTTSTVSYFDIVCLLDEAVRRAESMDDLLLIFAIRTHLSILLHKLYLSDELENIGEVIRDHGEISELEEGLLRWRDHPRTKSFLGMDNMPDNEYLNNRIQCFRDSLAELQAGPSITSKIERTDESDKKTIKDRFEYLGILFSYGDYFKREQAPAGKIYAVDDKTFSRQGFMLQNAVFRVLANHEVLRMWLSKESKRFARCEDYIWADNPFSVKTALDIVHQGKTRLIDLPAAGTTDSNQTQPKEHPFDPHQD